MIIINEKQALNSEKSQLNTAKHQERWSTGVMDSHIIGQIERVIPDRIQTLKTTPNKHGARNK